jgi:hypothetical protein
MTWPQRLFVNFLCALSAWFELTPTQVAVAEQYLELGDFLR